MRGLLSSPGLRGDPVKGVYFFPGESAGKNLGLYTTHPLLPDDQHWNSDLASRARVLDRMVAAHVNTVVMSYWGDDMSLFSPMILDPSSVPGVIQAVQGRPLVIMPALESGFDRSNPQSPHWEFSADFPSPFPGGPAAPGLVDRIGRLVQLFDGHMDSWARLNDRFDQPRYAVHLLHVYSDLTGTTDQQFADGFARVAARVLDYYGIAVGFTLDVVGGPYAYVATPAAAGPLLEMEPSVLAVHGFASEVFSGKVIKGCPCGDPDWRHCQPHDNNQDNLEILAAWKREAVHDWAGTGLPLILDVSNGNDGRIVWRADGAAFWGDNLEYTDDRWRNWMSQLKGPLVKGVTFDTWNGYTEGYAAVPSEEHGQIVYEWLTDLLEPNPTEFSHMHYVNGARTFRVYGAICEKWLNLGADRSFGAPSTAEMSSARGRVSFFADGKAIYWSAATGAHEVHGLIARTYWNAGADQGCLGLPISDEEPTGSGRVSHFEHGRIDWKPGELHARVTCH